jgi:hypothetical protein
VFDVRGVDVVDQADHIVVQHPESSTIEDALTLPVFLNSAQQ